MVTPFAHLVPVITRPFGIKWFNLIFEPYPSLRFVCFIIAYIKYTHLYVCRHGSEGLKQKPTKFGWIYQSRIAGWGQQGQKSIQHLSSETTSNN